MNTTFRHYRHPADYPLVSEFLIRHHQPGNADGNWLEPAWEYMHSHPGLDASTLERIGIWEENGTVVAVVTYESVLGEAFFQFHPAYRHLRQEMLDYAENHLAGVSSKDGQEYLCAFVNDVDREFVALVEARGYRRKDE